MSKNRVDSVMDFTVTLIQMSCKEGDRESNFARAREFLKNHKPSEGVDFIVLPELFAIGFRHEDYDQEGAGVPGSTSEFLSEIAKEHGAYVFATDVEKNGEKYYNTLAAANPSERFTRSKRSVMYLMEEPQ